MVVEWTLAATWAEGLSGDFMVGTVVLGVEAPQEVAADDTNSDVKDIYSVKVDM
jgi:hypothetical protein